MTVVQAAILGTVQGLTEFLPISSDGHLALAYGLLAIPPSLTFEILLHAATLVAMLTYFWSDGVHLMSSLLPRNRERVSERRLVGLITLATAVSAVIALGLRPHLLLLSKSIVAVALGFLGTTVLLVLAERIDRRGATLDDPSQLGFGQAGATGILQGLAALPGLSRSGSTISIAMFFRLSREHATRFSFLLGIPIITLAAVSDAVGIMSGSSRLPQASYAALIVGFFAAAVTGYAAIWLLMKFVKNHSLYWFAAYTGAVGTVMLLGATVFSWGWRG